LRLQQQLDFVAIDRLGQLARDRQFVRLAAVLLAGTAIDHNQRSFHPCPMKHGARSVMPGDGLRCNSGRRSIGSKRRGTARPAIGEMGA
jgi:hypothetical protein